MIKAHGETYKKYRDEVPMIIPTRLISRGPQPIKDYRKAKTA